MLHRNVCPASILVTKKGTWKLAGLEFTGKLSVYFKGDEGGIESTEIKCISEFLYITE